MPSGTIIMPSGTIIMPSGTIWLDFVPKLASVARVKAAPAALTGAASCEDPGSDLAGSVSAGDPLAPRGGARGGNRGESSQLR